MLFRVIIFMLAATLSTVPMSLAADEAPATPKVIMETSMGKIKIELFAKEAPMSVENFLAYVNEGFYDGLIFHRVIPGFMIQGGGFEPGMKNRTPTRRAIANEASNGLDNKRGTLSMARTNQIHSATSQFFINVADNKSLDHRSNNPQEFGYAVFGKVIEGMEVADKIVASPRGRVGQHNDVPKKDVLIIKAYTESSPEPEGTLPPGKFGKTGFE
ncbi:MAG: peptidylprolyl isomerase [Proteobacteria bacterium]|nr:peptidylprolyl isomerase [Pseudomonadota bacterium]MBU1714752.1 peptidylprolyl isomerase [Pseudomonadota bacterium]